MKLMKLAFIGVSTVMLSACGAELIDNKVDKTIDRGTDNKDLSRLQAGVWVDPRGCDHWIIDDGVEGYLSQRLDRNGKPVCSGSAPPGYATGSFKRGSRIGDPL